MEPRDDKILNQCLISIIEKIGEVIKQLQRKRVIPSAQRATHGFDAAADPLLDSAIQNNDAYTFSVDDDEIEMLEILTIDIQKMLSKWLPQLSPRCSNFIVQCLHPYQFDPKALAFTEALTGNLLHSLRHNLSAALSAASAFPAALRGEQKTVEEFLKKYPEYKDKPGYWSTTLLYSAAKGNHLALVKCLVEQFGCSVNAKNQSELNFLLINDNQRHKKPPSGLSYDTNPTLASTALHAACYNNNLKIVEYLVVKGANYFSRNQLGETPIQNTQNHREIQKFFSEYLVASFVNPNSQNLPRAPILECYDRRPTDCVWEFKPVKGADWEEFTAGEQKTLSDALTTAEDPTPFNSTIYLNVRRGIFSVNILTFLRGAKNQDPNPTKQDSAAWIRCRGSSVGNFDMFCVWQMMFLKYETNDKHSAASDTPLLSAETLPSVYDSKFRIKLNSWYTCDFKRNKILDEAVNYRRRLIDIDCNFNLNRDTKKIVKCNLFHFKFANDDKTIVGYLRWIPKLIENVPNERNVVKVLDNFNVIGHLNPTPLTTKRLERHVVENDDENDENDWKSSSLHTVRGAYEYDNDQKEKKLCDAINPNVGTWSVADLLHDKRETSPPVSEPSEPNLDDFMRTRANAALRNAVKIRIEEALKEQKRQKQQEAEKEAKDKLEKEIERLQHREHVLQRRLEADARLSQEKKEEVKNQIEAMKNELRQLQASLQRQAEEEERIKRAAEQITTMEFTMPTLDKNLTLNYDLITKELKNLDYPLKFYFASSVPRLELNNQVASKMALRGFPVHHKELEKILERIQNLASHLQSCKEFYREHNQRRSRAIVLALRKVNPKNLGDWQSFSASLERLIQEKSNQYVEEFSTELNSKAKKMMDACIINRAQDVQGKIVELGKYYMKGETFTKDMDKLKPIALDEFVEKHVLSQQKAHEPKPSRESAEVLSKYIDKIRQSLKTGDDYAGYGSNNLRQLATLLRRLMIFYRCFLTQLPLFSKSLDLLQQIENNTVTTISTVTGSGKSTLLPPLLAAAGYGRIVVTQPRRLPCTLLSQHVNRMIKANISGWQVSGDHSNKNAQIVYQTDGLLKEELLNNVNLITETSKVSKPVVFFIDEVHERSINIDLCLGLFARLLTLQPQLKSKMKLIISSATLDPSVPNLFRKIPGCSLAEFNLTSLSKLHLVERKDLPNENMLDLVQQLYSQRSRNDQILCFVNSTQDTHENCNLLKRMTNGTVIAYPLIQAQSAIEQQQNIETGCVFFSTTVAETSLTFPNLKYVIDTGLINVPVYNLDLQRTELKEQKCAQSTTKQRLGRLGRTQPGEYYALYDFSSAKQEEYPQPQICQCDLAAVEFSLRKSPLRTSLKVFQEFLPKRPDPANIADAINQLVAMDLIERSATDRLTKSGSAIATLPDFGSLPMAKAVYAGLTEFGCGRDMIILSSILSATNTSTVLKSIPSAFKDDQSDFMGLLKVMNVVLKAQKVAPHGFDVKRVCAANGLSGLAHLIKAAVRRFENLEEAFKPSKEFKELAQIQSNNWEQIARALLRGFSDKVYVSLKVLQSKTQQYVKYGAPQRAVDAEKPDSFDQASSIAVIDRSSILKVGKKQAVPAPIVLARDVRYLSAMRSSAILSFVGQIEPSWLDYSFTRELKLKPVEEKKLNDENIVQSARQQFSLQDIRIANNTLRIQGAAGQILSAELFIRQQLTTTLEFTLEPDKPNSNRTRNLKSIAGMPGDLFGPLRWRWESEHQVLVRVKMNEKQGTIKVTVTGLDSQNEQVQKEFRTFLSWLDRCAVIRHPDAGVSPRVLKAPIREKFGAMETRISKITDPERTSVDIWKSLKGLNATRTTRMEVVAWFAVCQCHCRLEGGFVRDWVVAGFSATPAVPQDQWFQLTKSGIPKMHPDLIPADLDCHLPQSKPFDIEGFLDKLHEHEMPARWWREDWRYVLLIDENTATGPFTVDLIEPHIALTHDRIDFDVSNLSLERGFTKDLGMRVDITGGPRPIQLETIVENIRNRNFQVLRPIDGEIGPNSSGVVADRVAKMKSRGWTQLGEPFSFIPDPPSKYDAVLIPYPATTLLYENIVTEMKKIAGAKVLSIEQIKNTNIEALYENMKRTIAQDCPDKDPQEKELFHGTSGEAIEGIISRGFDDRYFSTTGHWGRGAYFANDPRKSHGYATADSNTKHRVLFYTKVLLGVKSVQDVVNESLVAAPIKHHSVHGTALDYDEYVVYRYGQALPFLKITYTA